MVTSAPISSQNEVVWTILIKQALKEDRANLAYELYNNMKKRGFVPTGRNYTAILSGYNKLPDLTPKQWERVNKIWEHYNSYLEACRGRNGVEGSEVLSPHVPYFEMLGRLGEHDRMVSIFESMDPIGPLAPDKFLCTAVLGQIARRRHMDGMQRDDVYAGNASVIAKIADRMLQGGMIDSFAMCSILRGLVKGKDEHLELAWDILSKQVGSMSNPNVLVDSATQIDHFLFDVILELCCATDRHDLAIDLVDRAIKSKKMKTTVTRSHIHYALDALSYRAAAYDPKPPSLPDIRSPTPAQSSSTTSPPSPSPSPMHIKSSEKALSLLEFTLLEAYSGHPKDILPNISTYHRVFVIAWRTNDWITAIRVFQIMTGLDPAHFSDASFQGTPKSSKSPRTVVDMDAQCLSYLVRIACARDEVPLIKMALRISNHYDMGKMSSGLKGGGGDVAFYRYKHAAAMQEAIIRAMKESLSQEERTSYKRLLEVVKMRKAKLQHHPSDTNA
ncbi:hypothetical protein FRB94_009583 [Tulasnella sp. JGI-2019a]|nr:hypothetical protein FRB93_012638 [Tulasnella sp. JGI-2019a]KAG9010881.1 hypothetical protein FRB94_009583 [Tulasnella sp. JGI-2019a]